MKILVVDDDADQRLLLTLALEEVGGMQVITLPGGDSIVETAAAGSFDAILLDVVMPRIDGPHCLELLRADERTKGLPVIFLTARGSREDRASLGEENGIQTLAKPFDPISLADTLRGLLGQ